MNSELDRKNEGGSIVLQLDVLRNTNLISSTIRLLIWLENAPVFGVDKDEEVIAFIDQIITCSKPKLLELVNRQTHRHSHTCRKQSKNVCRFNYPHRQ